MTEISDISLIARAREHEGRTAIIDVEGDHTYGQLLQYSGNVAASLLGGDERDLHEMRVAFLVSPGFQYAATQWGIWRAGGVAVPLSVLHPVRELEYFVENSSAGILIAHPDYEERLRPLAEARGLRFMLTTTPQALKQATPSTFPRVGVERRAMILYTSGTTSRPKGVVTTHGNIQAQVASLITAWEWRSEDHILSVLPLHHVHGIINVLTCALWAGARCEMLPKFDAGEVWSRFARGSLTLFMAVPTIYEKLISFWEAAPPEERRIMSVGSSRMRLMVSGSAALPTRTLEKWKTITGHVLLERYGMTETGMVLSNPLHGRRKPGYVGSPLPGVEVKLADEKGKSPVAEGTAGEIHVRGAGTFLEYWGEPEVTERAFDEKGWFRTGDIAVREDGAYRILGRSSIDIIKTGGYKVSALEVEEVLRRHPLVEQCAVVGLEDSVWGERVCAALVLKEEVTAETLRLWSREFLAPYKIPTKILVLDDLPRNALGKVTKPDLVQMFRAK